MTRATLAISLLLACKSGGSSAPPKSDTPADGTTAPAGTAQDGDAATAGKGGTTSKCKATGRPWDGKPQGCAYEHDGCCYDAAEAACAAAGCEGPKCIVMESYPAQVRCDETTDSATP